MAKNVPTENTAAFVMKEDFESLGGIQKKPAIAAWVSEHYPERWDDKKIRGNLYGCCVNNPTGIRNPRSFPRFLSYRGVAEYELYDAARHGFFDSLGYPEGKGPVEESESMDFRDEADGSPVGSTEFAYEAHLRDYLPTNLHLLETGLSVWSEDALEFPVGNGRIDILARDWMAFPW